MADWSKVLVLGTQSSGVGSNPTRVNLYPVAHFTLYLRDFPTKSRRKAPD
uniref:Uncharacterized protein n=1 Tax=Peronospora matthiolae TaxID=2874970 RepID=A0AAV1VAC1_9STRA